MNRKKPKNNKNKNNWKNKKSVSDLEISAGDPRGDEKQEANDRLLPNKKEKKPLSSHMIAKKHRRKKKKIIGEIEEDDRTPQEKAED